MGRLKHLVDLSERVLLDELADLDASIHHQFEGGRIKVGRTSPVADGARMERIFGNARSARDAWLKSIEDSK